MCVLPQRDEPDELQASEEVKGVRDRSGDAIEQAMIALAGVIRYAPLRRKGGGVLTVNEYFDGRVKSIGFQDEEGAATSGVMEPGEYEFSTSTKERMTVMTGLLTIRRPSDEEWVAYPPGESFDVPGNVSFRVKVDEPTAYLCRYG